MSAVKLLFCGDALPRLSSEQSDPFAPAASLMEGVDIGFINLEGCITSDLLPTAAVKKKNILWTGPEAAPYLARQGFQVVNVANNHVFDLGAEACKGTINALRANGLSVVGVRDGQGCLPAIVERQGLKVGFLGYADYGFPEILMNLRRREALADVAKLRARVDLVVVSLHWGYEYVSRPSPRQRALARSLVDAGADVVVGQHPHISQGIEEYRGAIIAYSLGNFSFPVDEMPVAATDGERDARYGFVLSVTADAKEVRAHQSVPVSAFKRASVEVLTGAPRARADARLRHLSAELAAHRGGYLPWLWDASRAFGLLFRRAWAYRFKRFGASQGIPLARELAQEPLLVLLLLVSYIRFPRSREVA
jgi:poly-gamma-glutamate capsule biosynthesis protein CapA/YwtB (metallophosphatase superfamily)